MSRRAAYGTILAALLGSLMAVQAAGLYPPLELQWQFEAPGGFYAAPTVADGKVYAGALDRCIYALDAATGKLIWRFETGDRVYSGVAVAGRMAYAASSDKTLYALDATTGDLKWKKDLDGILYATPVVVGGLVFLGTGETGTLYALDAATGEERWTFSMGDRLGSGLTVANGRVYAGSYDHHLYALEAATGRLRWQFVAAGIVDSIPLVADGVVYVKLPDDTVYALDEATGKERWRYVPEQPAGEPDKLSNWSPLALAGGRLLFGSNDHHLYSLDAATGRRVWACPGADERPAAPTVVGNLAYAGGKDGTLTVLDVETGEVLWEWLPPQRTEEGFLRGIMWPPVGVGEWLYAASLDGHLYAFRGQRDAAAFARWRAEQTAQRRLLAEMAGEGGVTPTAAEVQAVQELGKRLRGFVVWESNRTGQWELYRINTDGTGFRQLTRLAEPNDPLAYRSYLRPRISPDGRWVLFAYGRDRAPAEVWIVPAEGGEARKLTVGTPLNWSPDGREVFLVRDSQVWRYELATGRETLLHPAKVPVSGQEGGMVGSVSPDLKAAVFRTPRANEYFVFDQGQTLKMTGGCEPGFTADGRYLYWVQGPKDFRIWDIVHDREWQILGQPPTNPHNYTYCPTVSADGHWLLYGASPNQHDHDTSDYEIFIVELKDWQAVGQPVRLSWHPRTDRWPVLWAK